MYTTFLKIYLIVFCLFLWLVGVFEKLLDFLGLPLYDPSGKYGFVDKAALLRVISVVRNESPTNKELDQQVKYESFVHIINS